MSILTDALLWTGAIIFSTCLALEITHLTVSKEIRWELIGFALGAMTCFAFLR